MSAIATAVVGSAVIGGTAAYYGAKEQSKAIKSSANTQAREQERLLDFQKQIYGDAQPFRDIQLQYAQTGAKALPSLYDYVMNPTMSEGARMAATEGQNLISQDAATAGSPTSGPAQLAKSNFLARLMASERDRQVNDMFRLSGFGSDAGATANNATGQSVNLMNTASGIGGNIANLQTAQGAVQGGLYNTIGSNISQLPMQYQLYQMMNQPSASRTGTGAMPPITSPYYYPSMNQYLGPSWQGGGFT